LGEESETPRTWSFRGDRRQENQKDNAIKLSFKKFIQSNNEVKLGFGERIWNFRGD
jgi:hypothetical protein